MPPHRRKSSRRIVKRRFPTIWGHVSRAHEREESIGQKSTASQLNIATYGRAFLDTFRKKKIGKGEFEIRIMPVANESSVGVGVFNREGGILGVVKIGFDHKTIIIEHFKGASAKSLNDQLIALTGMSWPKLAITFIEEHAKQNGYTHSRFRRAENQNTYQHPITGFEDSARHDLKMEETRREMKRIYGITAKGLGYKKKGNLPYKEKKL